HGARPGDALDINVEIIAVKNVSVNQRGEQVVRRGNGVKVAVEVKIDFLAGLDLRQSATGSSALHAEHRAERRLARSDNGLLPNFCESLGQANRGHGLAFTGSCGVRGGDQNQLAASLKSGIAEDIELKFGAVAADGLEI